MVLKSGQPSRKKWEALCVTCSRAMGRSAPSSVAVLNRSQSSVGQARKKASWRQLAFLISHAKSLLAFFGGAGGFALLTLLVLYFCFFLRGRGCILRENSGTCEKGKAECGGC